MAEIMLVNSLDLGINDFNYDIHLGTLSLATILKSKKYDVSVTDFNYIWKKGICNRADSMSDTIDVMCKYILNQQPKIVGISTMCSSHHIAIMLSKLLKEADRNIKIMLGGPQASLTAKETLEAFPWIDLICIGEGEENIEQIVEALLYDKDLSEISGIFYRKNEVIKLNAEAVKLVDLDKLPLLDYSLTHIESVIQMPIDAGRGCPFGCIYCSTKTFWKRKYRIKSIEKLIGEIKYIKSTYNINDFSLQHDLFTANRDNVVKFCDALIDGKINITWGCSARIDTLDEELISKLRSSGCNKIYLGIETGSKRMQKLTNKNLNLSKVWEIVKFLKKNNFKIVASFIYGFPDESLSDVKDTLSMIREGIENNLWDAQLHACTVLAGTELYEMKKGELKLATHFTDTTYADDISEFMNIVKKYPNIFPHFYDFEDETRQKLLFLDKFYFNIYITIIKKLPTVFKLMMGYYNNELINFFFDFKDTCLDILSNYKFEDYSSMSKKHIIFNKLMDIKYFIDNHYFGDITEVIKEVFKFETNIIEYKYMEGEFQKNIHKYDYDGATRCNMKSIA